MKDLQKFLELPRVHQGLLLRSALVIVGLQIGLQVLGFGRMQQLLRRLEERAGGRRRPPPPELLAWSIRTVGNRLPGASCLVQALAAQLLFRREGYPVSLVIGVARNPASGLEAHAWVHGQGQIWVGGLEATRFMPLAAMGSNRESA